MVRSDGWPRDTTISRENRVQRPTAVFLNKWHFSVKAGEDQTFRYLKSGVKRLRWDENRDGEWRRRSRQTARRVRRPSLRKLAVDISLKDIAAFL